ncbi:MAG: 50S ribosomal protein L11 methyltransferase [Fibrobacteria bacterium]|nr:50S ribosomal protein L11 methyltransferase [Fibrobacteria bacterium]
MNEDCPYQTLFIYEIKGIVKSSYEVFQKDFIGSWEEDESFTFLFFSSKQIRLVKDVIEIQNLLLLYEHIMPYADWESGDKIRPMRAGRYFIKPKWQNCATPKNSISLIMDPGVAFGSGYHPTTRDCLEFMSIAFKPGAFPDHVLDLGAGTAVLALAAAASGAKSVLAVEKNNLSARTALQNIKLNDLQGVIRLEQSDATQFVDKEWELVLANLTWSILKTLTNSKAFTCSKQLIVSGLKYFESEHMLLAMKKNGYELLNHKENDDWCTFHFRRDEV